MAFADFDQTEYFWAELKSDIVAPGQGVILRKGQFCFTDEDGNGTLDKARVVSGSRIPSVSARYAEYWKPAKPEEGRKGDRRWEFVYLGAGGGVLRFSAREYLDDPDRPSTQNEITYDLKEGEPTSFTFRGVKLEVLASGNDGIKLRLVAASGRHHAGNDRPAGTVVDHCCQLAPLPFSPGSRLHPRSAEQDITAPKPAR